MNWYIRRVIIYGRNRETREVEFEPGVNIITGDSKKGKSAILHIVDYCLGSSECNIPAGRVREFALAYGLLLQTPTEQIFLARPDPGIRTTASEMLLRIQPTVSIPTAAELIMTTNRDAVVAELSQRLGLMQMRLAEDQDDRDFSGRPSVRDLTAFMFQPQTIIDHNKLLFYRLEDPGYRRRLERIFPLVLGAVDETYFRLRTSIDEQKKVTQRLERDVQRAQALVGEGLAKARDLYNQASAFKLTDGPLQESWGFTELNHRLEDLVRSRPNLQQSAEISGVDVARIAELESQYDELRKSVRVLESELEHVLALDQAMGGYIGALDSQRDRLVPLGLFSEGEKGCSCPLCKQPLAHFTKEVVRLRRTNEQLLSELAEIKTSAPSLEEHRRKLQGDLKLQREQLRSVYSEIGALRASQAQLAENDRVEGAINRYLGRVEFYLENVSDVTQDGSLQDRLSQERNRLVRLQERLAEYDHQARQDAALRVVGRHMTAIASRLDLEWPDPELSLDLKRMTVVCDTPSGQPVFLLHMGSAANWVGCHLSALLGLHRFFAGLEDSPVPSILFIDQASQAYFPSDAKWDAQAEDTDRENVRKIFETVFEAVAKTDNKLQVIMIDHADYDDWPAFNRAVGNRRFRGNRALI